MTLQLTLTPETFDIGGWHPELNDDEVFLGIVPLFVFSLMGWRTKRHGRLIDGKVPVFVTCDEMIRTAKTAETRERRTLLKMLLRAEGTKRWVAWVRGIMVEEIT